MRINNNISALNAWRNLNTSNTQMGKSLEKLSSGFRINRAADDASGLVISQSLRAQISGLKQATRNAQDGISVVQTAEGALNEVHSMLNRMRDLAVQSANTGTNGQAARDAAQSEFDELRNEIDRIATSTSFGSQKLLDGNFGVKAAARSGFVSSGSLTIASGDTLTLTAGGGNVTVNLAAGTYASGSQFASSLQSAIDSALAGGTASQQALVGKFSVSSETIGGGWSVDVSANLAAAGTFTLADGTGTPLADVPGLIGSSTAAAGTGGRFQVGAYANDEITVSIGAVSSTGLSLSGLTVAAGDSSVITTLDTAIDTVSTLRGKLGATQNRFESTIANLQVTTENLAASESRIRDVDMASEMTNFTKQQVLLQAGTSMLGQANGLSQSVLSLLQ
ncbi:MAG: flagellin [Actinobacteria bacterium]|nr:flagellin [Actinomycetota bacterium]